ncbi:hypothetical protein AB0B83_08560 [Micromonospora sp. NPDC049060]|uniref:hypothetical protein n=1 Tax=Micromonospora sp. NPDC049060 TaxID=3154828 RepID=UPI0033E8D29A
MVSVKAYPFTWSPEIDEAAAELSGAMLACRAAERASNQVSSRVRRDAAVAEVQQ